MPACDCDLGLLFLLTERWIPSEEFLGKINLVKQ